MFLKNFINKYRKKIIIPLTLLLAFIGILNFYFVFEITPQPNDECLWKRELIAKDSIGLIFRLVKVDGVAWNAGIRDGDQLLKVEGKFIHNEFEAARYLSLVESGDSANYTVSRNGNIFETKVKLKKLVNFEGLSINLLAFIWLFVGFIVLTAKPDGYVQMIFYRIGTVLIFYSTFNLLLTVTVYNPLYDYPYLIIFGDLLWSFGGVFLPFTLIHFFWVFPRKFKFVERKFTIRLLYILPSLLFIGLLVLKFLFVYPGHWKAMYFVLAEVSLLNFMFIFANFIGLISLFINYRKLEKRNEKKAIFLILVGFTIGVASIIYMILIASVSNTVIFNNPEYYTPIILIALLPIMFAVSIFKYSLLDVSDVVKNTILYGTAMVAIAAVYFLIIYILGQGISSIIGYRYEGFVAGFVFIVIALVFQSTKDKFQKFITEKFYPEQFAFQKVIVKFNNDIANIVGLDKILDSTSQTVIDSLKIQKFGIMICNQKSGIYNLKRQYGLSSDDFSLQCNTAADELMNIKLQHNHPPIIDREEFGKAFPESEESLINEGIYTLIPLRIKSKIIGLLLFGVKYSGSRFAGKDLELLVSASNQIAISIENARLYLSETKKLKLDQDLENARKIQESLLPQKIPQLDNLKIDGKMIPAMQVGGDYYDVVKISDNIINILVGDVSGKGFPAAFYMMKLQTMIQFHAKDSSSPKEILSKVNRNITEVLEKHWFITVSMIQFNTQTMTAKFCRAGHTPLIVIKNHKEIVEYQPKGIGVGMENGDIFENLLEEIEIKFEPDDLFFIYSDGISEAMNNKKELYGEEKIKNVLLKNSSLEPEKIVQILLGDINSFRQEEEQNDDITLVLAKSIS